AEGVDTAEYFELLKTSLTALDQNVASEIVEAWFIMNFKKLVGEEINLYLDKNNKKLQPQTNYLWDPSEMVFVKNDRGDYGENEIKIMRLMMSTRPEVVARVKNIDQNMGKILNFARSVI
ncbi:hypothetical protein IJ135_02815, partial [Candidatus Saccharibacteria bacterium]|nr:hypothetical protein [Candidatus Saccharibacteria bacterium]